MGRVVAGQTKTFGIELGSVANAGKFQVNPTLDAADFRISINDGAFTALTNTPTVTPSGGAKVKVILAAAETTSAGAGGIIHFRASDSSGSEWQDLAIDFDVYATAEDTLVATVTNLTNAPTSGDFTATMKTSITTAATNATPTVTVGTNNDKTGYALSSAAITAIWAALTSGLSTVGSIGKLLVDNIDAQITSRMATFTYTAPPTVAQIRTELDNNSIKLDVAVSTRLANADYTSPPTAAANATAVWANSTRTLSSFGTLIADIWAYVTRTLTSSGSGGATAQEVWEYSTRTLSTPAPTATQIRQEMDSNSTKLANLDATVSSRLATSGYTVPPTALAIATAVWANSTRTLSSFSTLVADIWTNATRTLTSAGAGGATAQEVWEYILDGPHDARGILNIMFAVLTGKSTGGGTGAPAFRDALDTKNRASYTLDNNGNRTPTLRDGS